MQVTASIIEALNIGWKSQFNKGVGNAERVYDKICMRATSGSSAEIYGWLSQLPQIREWLGERHIHTLGKEGFKIENRGFESTIAVKRNDIADDKIGVYSPMFSEFGRRAAEFPDTLFAELIASGFTEPCYDGQPFFDTEHPVQHHSTGEPELVSNMTDGAGPAWYLLDLSRDIRPFIYQEREPFVLEGVNDPSDVHVFLKAEFLYGTRGRCNVGFGLWQMAYASKAELTPENYEAARIAMHQMKGDNERKLGIRGTHLLVPTELEGKARRLLKSNLTATGGSNEWMDSAELIVSTWL